MTLFLLANKPGDNLEILHLYWHLQQYLSQSLNNNMFLICDSLACIGELVFMVSPTLITKSLQDREHMYAHTYIHSTYKEMFLGFLSRCLVCIAFSNQIFFSNIHEKDKFTVSVKCLKTIQSIFLHKNILHLHVYFLNNCHLSFTSEFGRLFQINILLFNSREPLDYSLLIQWSLIFRFQTRQK